MIPWWYLIRDSMGSISDFFWLALQTYAAPCSTHFQRSIFNLILDSEGDRRRRQIPSGILHGRSTFPTIFTTKDSNLTMGKHESTQFSLFSALIVFASGLLLFSRKDESQIGLYSSSCSFSPTHLPAPQNAISAALRFCYQAPHRVSQGTTIS